VSNPVRQAGSSGNPAILFANASTLNLKPDLPQFLAVDRCTILSLEFVAKPESARTAPISLPAALQAAFQEMTGFRGSMVLVSEHEPRLITAVIFWSGSDWQQRCSQCLRRARALLAPYVDRSLRVQTMVAHLPVLREVEKETQPSTSACTVLESIAQEANVCVA
jgi:hypothetical protein